MEAKTNMYRVLVGKPEGSRPPGRHRCKWEDNIKMDLREKMEWYGVDLSGSDQGPDMVNMITTGVP
jgi:hypothetical protein